MKKKLLKIVVVLAMLLSSCKSQQSKPITIEKENQPNILFIHVDDLGYHDLSFNNSNLYQTPNIDRLANESVVFTNAYANFPRCVPSRYAMLTATWPIVNGKVPDDGFALNQVKQQNNIIKKISNSGYHTAFFGKWHLGEGKNSPTGFGFKYSFAAGKAGSPISYFFPFNTPTKENVNVRKAPMPDVDGIATKGDYLTDVLTTQVINHIESEKDKPFLIALNYYTVHQPIEAKDEDILRNENELKSIDFGNQPEFILEGTGRTKMRQDDPVYAGMVENLDENVGRILSYLKKSGLEENTIIVFSSDHGGLSNDGTKKRNLPTSNYPFRAGKGWLYEGGVRIPLFIKWLNHLPPRIDDTSIVTLMDLYPTFLDIISSERMPQLNGKSLLPVLNNNESWDNRTIYWHSDKARPINTGEKNASSIRDGEYKLIDFYEEGRIELYHLKTDIGEHNNLVSSHPKLKDSLIKKLRLWKSNQL